MELRNGVFKMMMILWGVVPIVLLVLTVIYLYKKINSAVKYFGAKEDVSYSSVNDSKIKTKYRIISIGIFALLIVPVVFFKMTWIIVLLHLFVLLLVTDLVVWIIEKIGHKINSTTFQRIYKSGIIAIVITAIMITYGYFNIFKVIDTQYTVYTEKNIRSEGYKILVLSDLHTGLTLNGEQLEQKVAEMSYQNPDVVILDGDIVDESTTFEQMQEAFSILSKISNRYGRSSTIHSIDEFNPSTSSDISFLTFTISPLSALPINTSSLLITCVVSSRMLIPVDIIVSLSCSGV